MFIPATEKDMRRRGWDALDVILVSGDTYTDNSFNGSAMIGHWLIDHGLRVGMIAQPRLDGPEDITMLGRPELFWSVSAGCVDSMVANYTSFNRRRKDDDFTPGGVNDRRPDRACIAYTNLIKRHAKGKPVILGGIEASLRRVAHYDVWTDSIRRSVLFDSKADAIVYGMGELSNLELARRMEAGEDWSGTRGICVASSKAPEDYVALPSYEDCASDPVSFARMFLEFKDNCDPVSGKGMVQGHGGRLLVHNPPQRPLTTEELDAVYESDYENAVHPYYAKQGHVKAMDTVENSVTTHRGCYGECSFCAIAMHQGRAVVSRSEESILREVRRMASRPGFNGIIRDVGGPTANMYGIDCPVKAERGACRDRRCLVPEPCPLLRIDHSAQIRLLRGISTVDGVRKAFVNSGVRYDMVVADENHGSEYLDELTSSHVSGQMKIAPEHVSDRVLGLMGKPPRSVLLEFKRMFEESNARCGKKQFLTYYFIAAHPGCTESDMRELSAFCRKELRLSPEQVQVFTPTPSTISTLMYHCGSDPGGRRLFVERSDAGKRRQKEIVVSGGRRRRGSRAWAGSGMSTSSSPPWPARSAATASRAARRTSSWPTISKTPRRKSSKTTSGSCWTGGPALQRSSSGTCPPTPSSNRRGRGSWQGAAGSRCPPKGSTAAYPNPWKG